MVRIFLLVFMGLLFCSVSVLAQVLTNDNALITITPSTRLSIIGGALNNGDIVNEGALSITGDWMNVDTYTSGTGLFIFNGADRQNIAHNGQEVYQLSVSGGGEKVFSSDMEIRDTLDLMDGVLTISNGVTLLVQANGTVSGGSDVSYVDGPLFHQGTGSKYFPVGSNGNFRPADLMNVTGTNPVVGIAMYEPNSDPTVPLQLLAVSDTRYWQLIRQSGSYDGSPIRLKLGPDERLGEDPDIQDIVVTGSDSIGGIFIGLGQSQFTGTIMDAEVTSSSLALNEFYALGVEGFAEERALYVPNAFSPAASDPEDQVVKVYGQQITDEGFIFRIYNRWGQMVYETTSFVEANTVGWYGITSSGEDESLGVYHYTLSGTFTSGRIFQRHGTIQVIQ